MSFPIGGPLELTPSLYLPTVFEIFGSTHKHTPQQTQCITIPPPGLKCYNYNLCWHYKGHRISCRLTANRKEQNSRVLSVSQPRNWMKRLRWPLTGREDYLSSIYLALTIQTRKPSWQHHHSRMAAVPRWPSAAILDIIEPEIVLFDPLTPKTLA